MAVELIDVYKYTAFGKNQQATKDALNFLESYGVPKPTSALEVEYALDHVINKVGKEAKTKFFKTVHPDREAIIEAYQSELAETKPKYLNQEGEETPKTEKPKGEMLFGITYNQGFQLLMAAGAIALIVGLTRK